MSLKRLTNKSAFNSVSNKDLRNSSENLLEIKLINFLKRYILFLKKTQTSIKTTTEKVIYNFDNIWRYKIIPYLQPRLYNIYELKSVSKRFNELILGCKHKSKYIKVPSDKFPTLNTAYHYIDNLMSTYCLKNNINPPEIWLDIGVFDNIMDTIRFPIVIRGMGMNNTILKHGLKFDISDNSYIENRFKNCKMPNLKIIIDNLSINNIEKSNNYNDQFHGISGNSEKFINILSCKIEKCNGSGIHGNNIKVNIKNSIICNNKNDGVHIWHYSILLADNLEIFNCVSGILIGNIKSKENSKLNDIYIHNNHSSGLSIGGWDSGPDIIVTGNKTDISYNNLIVKHKYVYGVSTDYSGKLIFKGLDKNISHDNYNDQNINSRHNSEVIFINL